jgi:hypothetical protein
MGRYVAVFDDGLGRRVESRPFKARDLLAAMAKASQLRQRDYPTGRVVNVKEHRSAR